MKHFSHLHSALSILKIYNGNEPFHLFIKRYFSANKKFGSKDRKQIASLCYNYFRLGKAATNISSEERILLGTFLCENKPSIFLEAVKPEWNSFIEKQLEEKLAIVNSKLLIKDVFSFTDELSEGIDAEKFSRSFLIQPKLFIRIRPEFKSIVVNKIKQAGFIFEELGESCIALSNNQNLKDAIVIDKEAVIQDFNSQKTLDFIKRPWKNNKEGLSIWDCCAGSGGKSILAYDLFKKINLTVTDRRKSILENLKLRFDKSGITNYKFAPSDLEMPLHNITETFDLIIADVPCSGSGTWARTPEQLHFFKKDEIEKYASLQRKIVENASPHLKNNGHLLYITCSVFKKENEENVIFFGEKYKLNLLKVEYLKGYEIQADTLFVALFKKSE